MIKLTEFDTNLDMYQHLRNQLLKLSNEGNDGFHIALCGGSSPLGFFEYMGNHTLDTSLNVYWVDERLVPSNDERNNAKWAIESWLSKEPIQASYPILTENISGTDSATYYQRLLAENCSGSLDCILLGMGEDGHIASMFPNMKMSLNQVFNCYHPTDGTQRISLSMQHLIDARTVYLIVSNNLKRQVLEDAELDLPVHQLITKRDVHCLYVKET